MAKIKKNGSPGLRKSANKSWLLSFNNLTLRTLALVLQSETKKTSHSPYNDL